MNDIFRDVTSIALAIVGVALLYVLVAPNSQTARVIDSASSGFARSLTAAMGGGAQGGGRSTLTGL